MLKLNELQKVEETTVGHDNNINGEERDEICKEEAKVYEEVDGEEDEDVRDEHVNEDVEDRLHQEENIGDTLKEDLRGEEVYRDQEGDRLHQYDEVREGDRLHEVREGDRLHQEDDEGDRLHQDENKGDRIEEYVGDDIHRDEEDVGDVIHRDEEDVGDVIHRDEEDVGDDEEDIRDDDEEGVGDEDVGDDFHEEDILDDGDDDVGDEDEGDEDEVDDVHVGYDIYEDGEETVDEKDEDMPKRSDPHDMWEAYILKLKLKLQRMSLTKSPKVVASNKHHQPQSTPPPVVSLSLSNSNRVIPFIDMVEKATRIGINIYLGAGVDNCINDITDPETVTSTFTKYSIFAKQRTWLSFLSDLNLGLRSTDSNIYNWKCSSQSELYSGIEKKYQPVASTYAPLLLELKQSTANTGGKNKGGIDDDVWNGLKQSIDRILYHSELYGFMRRMFVMLVLGSCAWLIVYERDETKLTKRDHGSIIQFEQCIRIFRIPGEQRRRNNTNCGLDEEARNRILHTWGIIVQKCIENSSFYLTEDGNWLVTTLHKMGFNPLHCRTQLAGASMSRVYLVKTLDDKRSIPAEFCDFDFALKIVLDSDSFSREVRAGNLTHKKISESSTGSESSNWFYMLGYLDTGNVHYFQDFYTSPGPDDSIMYVSWIKDVIESEKRGGVIIMRVGKCTLKQYLKENKNNLSTDVLSTIFNGVSRSLTYLHSANLVHCDIRSSNIMYFGRTKSEYFNPLKWQLIDYGLSTEIGEISRIDINGARYKSCGYRLSQIKTQKNWRFYIGDDYEMLYKTLHGKAS